MEKKNSNTEMWYRNYFRYLGVDNRILKYIFRILGVREGLDVYKIMHTNKTVYTCNTTVTIHASYTVILLSECTS